MNAAHVHLLVNHLPIVGAMVAVPVLMLAAALPRQRGLVVAVAVVLTVAAGGGGLALVTGDGAEDVVERLPDVREADIETHEKRAEVAIGFAVVAALASLVAAGFEVDRGTPTPRLAVLGLLVLALADAGAMAWAGAAGGVIRHTEIRAVAGSLGAERGAASPGAERRGHDDHHD